MLHVKFKNGDGKEIMLRIPSIVKIEYVFDGKNFEYETTGNTELYLRDRFGSLDDAFESLEIGKTEREGIKDFRDLSDYCDKRHVLLDDENYNKWLKDLNEEDAREAFDNER